MNKLIWKMYNENRISLEVAEELLDWQSESHEWFNDNISTQYAHKKKCVMGFWNSKAMGLKRY